MEEETAMMCPEEGLKDHQLREPPETKKGKETVSPQSLLKEPALSTS